MSQLTQNLSRAHCGKNSACCRPSAPLPKMLIVCPANFVSLSAIEMPCLRRAAAIFGEQIVPLRWQEVAVPLIVIVSLLILKYVPALHGLPLSRTAGVIAFFYAAFLALRLVQSEEAVQVDGWSELRPSMVEYFAGYGAAALAVVLMSMVIVIGGTKVVDPTHMVATFTASLALGAGALAVGLGGLFVKVRWNNALLEHHSAFGKQTKIAWSDVRSVRPNWPNTPQTALAATPKPPPRRSRFRGAQASHQRVPVILHPGHPRAGGDLRFSCLARQTELPACAGMTS
ncbi:MAG TPA: hypothetical protein VL133_15390 [Devosia sp.]|nr:hypothetical protein [Devosia sp.]